MSRNLIEHQLNRKLILNEIALECSELNEPNFTSSITFTLRL